MAGTGEEDLPVKEDDSSEDGPSGTLCSLNLRKKRKSIVQLDEENAGLEQPSVGKARYAAKLQKLSQTGKLEHHRAQESLRHKMYIASLSEDRKIKSNAATRERMRRYRERLIEKQKTKQCSNSKVLTRKEKKIEEESQKKKREYWRG
ncbi:uncharacterized protein LOC110453201 [Mizuhopecten yessoensis]|nr:uncharacterized protein LOC110453201 [Mizuhopecten yessoensis]